MANRKVILLLVLIDRGLGKTLELSAFSTMVTWESKNTRCQYLGMENWKGPCPGESTEAPAGCDVWIDAHIPTLLPVAVSKLCAGLDLIFSPVDGSESLLDCPEDSESSFWPLAASQRWPILTLL